MHTVSMMSHVGPYMLDTNVFNDVLDGKLSLVSFENRCVLATDVQAGELRVTSDAKRRAALLSTFKEIRSTSVPAETFCFGIEGAGFGAKWNDGSGNFEKMLRLLQQLDRKNKKGKKTHNQWKDILIAEAAIKNGATLVSGDPELREVVSAFGGRAIDISSF